MKSKTFSVLTLGCSKNVVDSENLIGILEKSGLEATEEPNNADYVIVNTCGFIKPAKEESIKVIFEAAGLKHESKLKKLIVVGCLSERYGKELREQIPEVDHFFGVNETGKVLQALSAKYDDEELKHYLQGERKLLTPEHYAYMKISEGCNHKCSFCAIPLIRGKYISRPIEELLVEARALAGRGVREISVIAQDTTYYGYDLYGKRAIPELLEKLSAVESIEWLRLMYAYPTAFPHEILEIIASNEKICNYIDIPLQHISDKLLKSMQRGITGGQIKDLIEKIRKIIPNVAIRTAFITGYPGETDDDFRQLLDFITEYELDRVGVFIYSHEENTGAFELKDNVPEKVKAERRDILMRKQNEISLKLNKRKVGSTLKIMIDGVEGKHYLGRSQYDAPEVDNAVIIKTKKKLKPGSFHNVIITGAKEYDLIGELK